MRKSLKKKKSSVEYFYTYNWKGNVLGLNEAKKAILDSMRKLNSARDKITDPCTIPIWVQYKEHKAVFTMLKKKMHGFQLYYSRYKDALKQFEMTVHDPENIENHELLTRTYREIWEVIFDFLESKEYLCCYNPAFLVTKGKKERDKILDKMFEFKPIDIEKEFTELILHLLYSAMLKEKYENLKKLRKVVLIERKFKEFINRKRNKYQI